MFMLNYVSKLWGYWLFKKVDEQKYKSEILSLNSPMSGSPTHPLYTRNKHTRARAHARKHFSSVGQSTMKTFFVIDRTRSPFFSHTSHCAKCETCQIVQGIGFVTHAVSCIACPVVDWVFGDWIDVAREKLSVTPSHLIPSHNYSLSHGFISMYYRYFSPS